MYIPSAISLCLLKLGLEFPAMLVRWCQIVAGSFASEGAVAVGFGGSSKESGASFRDDPWRIKRALTETGVLIGALILGEIPCSPSLVFIGTGTDAKFYGRILRRYIYQLVKLGWFSTPPFLLRSVLFADLMGISVFEAAGSLLFAM